MSINLHGTITEDNYEDAVAQTAKYGALRVTLSLELAKILDQLNLVWSIDGGTLLGAWRDGTMLKHDDDFDLVVYHPSLLDSDPQEAKREYLLQLEAQIKPLLPEPYRVRTVTSYAQKLEIYDPTHGAYPFRDTDYHNVTCDLTLLLHKTPELLQFQHAHQMYLQIPTTAFLPLSTIEYEGHTYRAPGSPEGYLKSMYGYLGPNAVFDKATGLYVPKTEQ